MANLAGTANIMNSTATTIPSTSRITMQMQCLLRRLGGMATYVAIAATFLVATLAAEARAQNGTPFGSTYRRPTVSPYTMLATPQAASGVGQVGANGTFNPLIYQQLIQPRFEQESGTVTQMQQGRQLNNLQGRVQQIQRDTSGRQINETIRATGHTATFQNLSHFYPGGR